ncbi:hypothetical protein HDU78_005308 [Chytriomyces hyalinus]|nr:hypothetical protein HDU78_005308 [Chytriomyces hyalinus]
MEVVIRLVAASRLEEDLISQHKCTHMTWEDHTKCVMMKFGSRLSLNQALDALDEPRQTTSASAYSAKFNNLVPSISVTGAKFSPKHICSCYCKNLKNHLKALADIVKTNKNLMLLQQQAEYLDDIAFCSIGNLMLLQQQDKYLDDIAFCSI